MCPEYGVTYLSGRTFGSIPGAWVKQILVVNETPLLEERSFDPADEVLDRSVLPRGRRPTHFNSHAQIDRNAGEERIPFGDVAVARPR